MKTIEEQISCAARELAVRRGIYPKWVAQNKMTQQKADHEIECMEEILKTLNYRKDLLETGNDMVRRFRDKGLSTSENPTPEPPEPATLL